MAAANDGARRGGGAGDAHSRALSRELTEHDERADRGSPSHHPRRPSPGNVKGSHHHSFGATPVAITPWKRVPRSCAFHGCGERQRWPPRRSRPRVGIPQSSPQATRTLAISRPRRSPAEERPRKGAACPSPRGRSSSCPELPWTTVGRTGGIALSRAPSSTASSTMAFANALRSRAGPRGRSPPDRNPAGRGRGAGISFLLSLGPLYRLDTLADT